MIAVTSKCLKCGSSLSLSPDDHEARSEVRCLICGWRGELDESGKPTALDSTAPEIPRRKRRKRKHQDEEAA